MGTGHAPLRRFRALAYGLYAAALALYVATVGVPSDASQVMLWLLIGLIVVSLVSPKRRTIRVFFDWLPFGLALFAWDWSRGIAVRIGLPVHVQLPIDIEKFLFFGTVPTVWLQQHLGIDHGQAYPWQAVPTLIYVTHFFATPVVAAYLWVKNRKEWIRYLSRWVTLMGAGLITYILLPWSPPWMASQLGFLPPIHRSTPDGWQFLHLSAAGTLLSVGQAGVNENAALPSLHAAFAILISMFLWRRARTRGKVLLALYAIGMAVTLVVSAEHYVIDILLGWIYAAVVHLAWNAIERRRRATRRSTVDTSSGETPGTDPTPAIDATPDGVATT